MSEPQATRDPVTEFLAVLGDELLRSPSELSMRRHVKAAAATARRRPTRRRGFAIRSGSVAAAAVIVLGTSGVALAGGLPRPVQTMVADAAHMLPVPLPIPYPAAPPIVELPPMENLLEADAISGDTTAPAEPHQSATGTDLVGERPEPASDSPAAGATSSRRAEDGTDRSQWDATRSRESETMADGGQWDDPNGDGQRGWVGWRGDEGRGTDPVDRAVHDNDRHRSSDNNRDR